MNVTKKRTVSIVIPAFFLANVMTIVPVQAQSDFVTLCKAAYSGSVEDEVSSNMCTCVNDGLPEEDRLIVESALRNGESVEDASALEVIQECRKIYA